MDQLMFIPRPPSLDTDLDSPSLATTLAYSPSSQLYLTAVTQKASTLSLDGSIGFETRLSNGQCFLDSGSPHHLCGQEDRFDKGTLVQVLPWTLCHGDRQTTISLRGTITLTKVNGKSIKLTNVWYYPKFKGILLSEILFFDPQFNVINENGVWEISLAQTPREIKNGTKRTCFVVEMQDNYWFIDFSRTYLLSQEEGHKFSSTRPTLPDTIHFSSSSLYMMKSQSIQDHVSHLHSQCHANFDAILTTIRQGTAVFGDPELTRTQIKGLTASDFQCESCDLAKMRNKPFKPTGHSAEFPGELLHVDMFGPVKPHSNKMTTCLVIMDEYTRYKWAIPSPDRATAAVFLRWVVALLERQCGYEVKAIQSDNAPEFMRQMEYFAAKGIRFRTNVPYTPQQNGSAERTVQTIKSLVRAQLHHYAPELWANAAEYTTFMSNCIYTRSYGERKMTPYEAMYGRRPVIPYTQPFGVDCIAYVPSVQRDAVKDTWAPHAHEAIYLGETPMDLTVPGRPAQLGPQVFDVEQEEFRTALRIKFPDQISHRLSDELRQKHPNGLQDEQNEPIATPATTPTPNKRGRGRPKKSDTVDPNPNPVSSESYIQTLVDTPTQIDTPLVDTSPTTGRTSSIRKTNPSNPPEESRGNTESLTNPTIDSSGTLPEKSPTPDLHISSGTDKEAGRATILSSDTGSTFETEYISPTPVADSTTEAQSPQIRPPRKSGRLAAQSPQPAPASYTESSHGRRSRKRGPDDWLVSETERQAERQAEKQAEQQAKKARKLYLIHLPEALATFDHQVASSKILVTDVKIPRSIKEALNSSNPYSTFWKLAIEAELNAMVEKGVMAEVPPEKLPDTKLISTMYVFAVKSKQGLVTRFKARLVARGDTQRPGIDHGEFLYAPTSSIKTIRLLCGLACKHSMHVLAFDVKTAFLNAPIDKDIYVTLPYGSYDVTDKGKRHCYKLHKALYGLKQAPKLWYDCFVAFLKEILGFTPIPNDENILTLGVNETRVILVIYVDDTLVMSEDLQAAHSVINKIRTQFKTDEPAPIGKFLGMTFSQSLDRKQITIEGTDYIQSLEEAFGLKDYHATNKLKIHPQRTSTVWSRMKSSPKSTYLNRLNAVDTNRYQQLVGGLRYLTTTLRPDIANDTRYLSRFLQAPLREHWIRAMDLAAYVCATKHIKLEFNAESPSPELHVYADASFNNVDEDNTSTYGYISRYLGGPVHWESKLIRLQVKSTRDAELYALSEAVRNALKLRTILWELGYSIGQPTAIYEDNAPLIATIDGRKQFEGGAQYAGYLQGIKEVIRQKDIVIKQVTTKDQLADFLTKSLPFAQHTTQMQRLNIYPS